MPEPRNKTCKIVGVTDVHEDFYFGLLTSSLMRGIHMGEISKLGWLMSYVTGHNSFTSQYLLNIYIYCRFCRLCIINVRKKYCSRIPSN
jgi:hypothetical protein